MDAIVNGTGHGRHNSPILESLKNQGLASVNLHLDTLRTDATGYRLADSGITCIGPATHFGTDGLESFAPNVKAVADFIIDKARKLSIGQAAEAVVDRESFELRA